MSLSKYETVSLGVGIQLFSIKRVCEESIDDPFFCIDSNALARQALDHLGGSSIDEQFIKGFFLFYRKKFKVWNLADYVAHIKSYKDPSFSISGNPLSETINLVKERRQYEPSVGSLDDARRELRLDLYNAMEYLSRGTIYSESAWNYFGGGNRMEYVTYKTIVKQVLETCPGSLGTKVRKSAENHTCERLQELQVMHDHIERGLAEGSRFRLRAFEDLLRVSKFASFDTISSWDCYRYLGERFRFEGLSPTGSRNKHTELSLHLDLVARVLQAQAPIELRRIRGAHLSESFRALLARKLDMIELRRRFGIKFCNWRNGSKEELEKKYCNYGIKMTIFWGLLYDQKKRSVPSFSRVVKELIDDELLSQKDIKHYQDIFIRGYAKDYDAEYFFCTPTQYEGFKNYMREHGAKNT